jgi:acyl-coenzyme A thioesterase PaaI-like protein
VTDFDAIAQGMTQAVPFAGFLGLEITHVAAGESTVLLPERVELTNHVGSQHAGALFTAAEAASGAAFVGAFAERMGEVTPLARAAEISYEKIAKGPIEARAKLGVPAADALATLDAEGKVVFPCEIELADASGQRVATATVQWHVRLNQPTEPEAA